MRAMRFEGLEIRLSLAQAECEVVVDGRGNLPHELALTSAPPDELPPERDVPYGCLLVRAEQTILVDTGQGRRESPFGGLGGELADADLTPEVVVITHRHGDHIGGLLDGLFPSARHVMPRAEWEAVREQVQVEVEPLDGELQLADGVTVLPTPGHTPGHVAVEIGAREGLLWAADAFLHPLQVERPEWTGRLDADAEATVETRHALLARAAERGHVLAASHWEVAGTVEETGGGYRLRP
jgi:glyoxylase-like metal-dependent hydrolase (beta-lactamase superfamily II)